MRRLILAGLVAALVGLGAMAAGATYSHCKGNCQTTTTYSEETTTVPEETTTTVEDTTTTVGDTTTTVEDTTTVSVLDTSTTIGGSGDTTTTPLVTTTTTDPGEELPFTGLDLIPLGLAGVASIGYGIRLVRGRRA